MSTTISTSTTARLEEKIVELGPWHLNVQVTPEIGTSIYRDAIKNDPQHAEASSNVAFVDPGDKFKKLMQKIYPNGLKDKRFLDCACNCGGYSFWAKELGASECFGFDVREHWINQANFLLENRTFPNENVNFAVQDLYDLQKQNLKPFDITLFKGIFYHLPDPVSGLKLAADLTTELLYLDTATRSNFDDGALVIANENKNALMSGMYNLNWFPTGPKVLMNILQWAGFQEFHLLFWRKDTHGNSSRTKVNQNVRNGRLALLASKKPGLFDGLEKERSDRRELKLQQKD
ncbi:Protein of unknown function (DUF1698) [Xenococcus sp. PCC 7305]|uniref:class I SAM-dependent methyltransferase n=1 Tax=Xenococcus sp. PCC 7305 TaxID=102125 RepID=UPI0002ACBC0F|nr:methyltransferase domain-containing protein [Xenococcus sp. PCC 7305]ELS04868.1 Protein of unknown function (DUF1698) [Xenococcus sp. PCC 7305]